jgi:hypothetical protein
MKEMDTILTHYPSLHSPKTNQFLILERVDLIWLPIVCRQRIVKIQACYMGQTTSLKLTEERQLA